MKIEFIYTDSFQKDLKPLLKKYRSIPSDLEKLEAELEANPHQGAKISENTYKVRMAIKSKGKGKSGGARVITYLIESIKDHINIYFITIYDKSRIDNIATATINYKIKEIHEELDIDEESSLKIDEEPQEESKSIDDI